MYRRTLVDLTKAILLNVTAVPSAQVTGVLKGIAGRGANQYGVRLKEWLESGTDVFPEPIQVEYIDHPQDHGVDVLMSGARTGVRIGFQIKSDGDLANQHFVRELKAQITDSLALDLSLLVIVLACAPTEKNEFKYKYLQLEMGRYAGKPMLLLDPCRAAGLLGAFSRALAAPPQSVVTWSDLLLELGQEQLIPLYVDRWSKFAPDARFKAPDNFSEVCDAVAQSPLTIITGPPAVGKTFLALQLLWRAFREGKPVRWIAPTVYSPTDGPIPLQRSAVDMRERIGVLVRKIGLQERRIPLDSSEFIACHLEPNSLVYIEDPFGKTSDEFAYGLHTHRFFDLKDFVAAIKGGTARNSCRIILSSRLGLFERWRTQHSRDVGPFDGCRIVTIETSSYGTTALAELGSQLAQSRMFLQPLEVASALAPLVETPYEIEQLIISLPADVIPAAAIEHAGHAKLTLGQRVFDLVRSERQADRLFLFLFSALQAAEWLRHKLPHWYHDLHTALRLGPSAKTDLDLALARYAPIFALSSWHADSHRTEKPYPNGSYLSIAPVHSTISEAITDYLRKEDIALLERIAEAIPLVPSHYGWEEHGALCVSLLSLGIGVEAGSTQDHIFDVLQNRNGLSRLDFQQFARVWPHLDADMRRRALDYISQLQSFELGDFVGCLVSDQVSAAEMWEIYRVLVTQNRLGVGPMWWSARHPWLYFLERIAEAPEDLANSLSELAVAHPQQFVSGLGHLIIEEWQRVPSDWKQSLFDIRVRQDAHLLTTIFLDVARDWARSPEELRTMYLESAASEMAEVRAMAAIVALIRYKIDPETFGPVCDKAVEDTDIEVPFSVFKETFGAGERRHDFAKALVQRAPMVIAARMLDVILVHRNQSDDVPWFDEIAQQCILRGGELSRAVLTYYALLFGWSDLWDFVLSDAPEYEPEVVRLAWVWAYGNAFNKRPNLSLERLKVLVIGMGLRYRLLALLHLSQQADHLPDETQKYVRELELEARFIMMGIGRRGEAPGRALSRVHTRPLPDFPVGALGFVQEHSGADVLKDAVGGDTGTAATANLVALSGLPSS